MQKLVIFNSLTNKMNHSRFSSEVKFQNLQRKNLSNPLFQILVVSECTLKRLGDLSFSFRFGTCGTFMINSLPRVLLCFDDNTKSQCRSYTRRNDGKLGDINNFVFENEFDLGNPTIPETTHQHYLATLANYQGLPVILGGTNNKLEMLNSMENPSSWVEGTDYPYSNG